MERGGSLAHARAAEVAQLYHPGAAFVHASAPLFQTDIVDTGIRTGPMSWDIAPDGRFLIISHTSTDAAITVVLNRRAAELN